MKILIVDDNERIRKIIMKLLDNLSTPVEVIECEDGEEAIKIFSTEHPDLVLMDIVMDCVDGLQVTKRIIEKNKNAKIIIVSQLPEDEYRQEALNSGAITFLNKENLSDLPKLISDYLKEIDEH